MPAAFKHSKGPQDHSNQPTEFTAGTKNRILHKVRWPSWKVGTILDFKMAT